MEGVRGGFGPEGGVPKAEGGGGDPPLPHAYVEMHDVHFATNHICIAPRFANLVLKTWTV